MSEIKHMSSGKSLKQLVTESGYMGPEFGQSDREQRPVPQMPQRQEEPSLNDKIEPEKSEVAPDKGTSPEVGGILASIRLAVIQGLAKLAERPDTVEYDVLKKILTIVDKPMEQNTKRENPMNA